MNNCVTSPHPESTIHSIDHVPQNVVPSNNRVHLFVFEDNEAVITMIIEKEEAQELIVSTWFGYLTE